MSSSPVGSVAAESVAAGSSEKKIEPCKFGYKCNNYHCSNYHTEKQQEVRKYLLESLHAQYKINGFMEKIEKCVEQMNLADENYSRAIAQYESAKLKNTRDKSRTRGKSRTRASDSSVVVFDDKDENEKELLAQLAQLRQKKNIGTDKERGRAQTRT
jgi:hypothetical protein